MENNKSAIDMIQSYLAEIERNYNVKILFAIELGCRAWGKRVN